MIDARKPTALEKSRRRAEKNLRLGTTLGTIAETCRDVAAQVTADLLKLSADEKANGELTNLKDKKGRVFNCPQSFISADSQLDTNYQKRTATRHRRIIYESFKKHLPDIVEHDLGLVFITPTFPNLLGVGFADNDRFQTLVWEKFLQTKIFRDCFYGGYSKTEWTTGNPFGRRAEGRAFDLKKDGINYHIHALAIIYKDLAEGETSQLENKLVAMNKDKRWTAADRRTIRASLRLISAWTDSLRKAHKQIFGKSLRIKTNSGRARFTIQKLGADQIKEYDPDESKNGIFWEIAKAASYTAKGSNFDDLPPELILEAENTFRNKRMINGFGVFRKHAEKKTTPSERLVKPATQQTQTEPTQPDNSLFDNVMRQANESLKSYGIRLCSHGLRHVWERYLELNKDLIIANKRNRLLQRFPNSVFTDLTGKTYYGWHALKLIRQKEEQLRPDYDPTTDKHRLFEEYQTWYFAVVDDLAQSDNADASPYKRV